MSIICAKLTQVQLLLRELIFSINVKLFLVRILGLVNGVNFDVIVCSRVVGVSN